jgi:hypothetical protein
MVYLLPVCTRFVPCCSYVGMYFVTSMPVWEYKRLDGSRSCQIFKTKLRSFDLSINSLYGKYEVDMTY